MALEFGDVYYEGRIVVQRFDFGDRMDADLAEVSKSTIASRSALRLTTSDLPRDAHDEPGRGRADIRC